MAQILAHPCWALLAHTHQRNTNCPQLSSQFTVNLQKDLLSDAAELLRMRDGAHIDGLEKEKNDTDIYVT